MMQRIGPDTTQSPWMEPVVVRLEAPLSLVQAKVRDVVAEHPGCSIQQVALHLRVSHATASYHLFSLARLGILAQVRDGREVRHFPGASSPGAYLRALLRDGRKARVAQVLTQEGADRLSLHQMARQSKVTFAFLKRTLHQLEWVGLVRLERRRHRYTVRPGPDAEGLMALTGLGSAGEANHFAVGAR